MPFFTNSTYIDLTMQESRGVEGHHTRSDDLRSALLGNHMQRAVSRAAAGMIYCSSKALGKAQQDVLCVCMYM